MVKRGRDISNLHISVDVRGRLRLKKFTWFCEVCGAEYISRADARACEAIHELLSRFPCFLELEELRSRLALAEEATRKLVGGG